MQLNPHYAELNESYLFSTIAHKVADYQKAHPEADVIRLGIGDVTLPLAASVTEAMHKAVEEQGRKETFHGYIPSEHHLVSRLLLPTERPVKTRFRFGCRSQDP